jgi:LPXTG-site transpeptidase (sortase) family protein
MLKKRKSNLLTKIGVLLSTGLILAGLLISLVYVFSSRAAGSNTGQAIHSTQALQNNDPVIEGNPVRIQVPSVSIDLKVIPGNYYPATKSWSLSLNDAQFAKITNEPNNRQGLTFIYAHYRKGVFINLPKIQPGAEVIITTDNGHTFTYTYTKNIVTNPNDTSLFTYQGKPLLVLQTCSGFWFQNRQLFLFDLRKVD